MISLQKIRPVIICIFLLFSWNLETLQVDAQDAKAGHWSDDSFKGLEFRNIGPALMSGRIADVAIHPQDDNTWYLAVGSGGVWKTKNAGVTWKPIFDDQSSYSIGCVTIDPMNPNIVWVGTGENVGGRHVGYGDGVYRSLDGGENWENVGLPDSQHISKIVVHPNDSNTVWVASQGPLWNKGGDRGLFKTIDGGKNWKRVLGDDQWVGVTDIVLDPRDPQQMYAATWQRHRTVAAYMGGGPGTGLYRSHDGGESWAKMEQGLPKSNMGKIGLAISPQKPDVLYAAIELDRRTGGVYRSADRGATWSKMSDTVSGATGPHYYQELYACPHNFDRLYLMDVRIWVSDNGGKQFRRLSEKHKHSDNHAMAFRTDDPDYLLVGTDGGLYESFDLAENWRFMDNLPLTQFYKLALDDSEPFFNIYGGTQDNSTEGGPSRTDSLHGIQNSDWRVVLDWDGHQPATEPGNPNILYGERQEGYLARIDLKTGEIVDIQPQAEPGEDIERFNWDAPILVSPHSSTRLYFASQRVWRSDNRGDSWKAVSSDLTKNQTRLALPIMGGVQSWDNAWDLNAMSNYNTITSIAESPVKEGLLYAGTDDGLIQVTLDGGKNWSRMDVGQLPGVPATAFVNNIVCDLFEADTVYVALDNHKYGDFRPYLLKSTDAGKTWKSIRNNIPDRNLIWRLVQDHEQPGLMFCATEFGIYFTINGGDHWFKLSGGLPTISFRDIAIHRRENDLVAASFGRGFFVFDDISVFRELAEQTANCEATLFSTRRAWWYFQRPQLSFDSQKGEQGASHFVAPNPPFGAVFTYFLNEDLKTKKDQRVEREKHAKEKGLEIEFPGWDALEDERREEKPEIWLTVADSNGNVVRRIKGAGTKGFHRVAWDLRYPAPNAIELIEPEAPMWGGPPQGLMVAPGTFTVSLSKVANGKVHALGTPQAFEVKPLRSGSLKGASPAKVAKFWRDYESTVRLHSAASIKLANALTKIKRMKNVLTNSTTETGAFDQRLARIRHQLQSLDHRMNGNRSKAEPGEKFRMTIGDRLFAVSRAVDRSTYGPTKTSLRGLEIANKELADVLPELKKRVSELSRLAQDLVKAGAPWIEGELLPKNNERKK